MGHTHTHTGKKYCLYTVYTTTTTTVTTTTITTTVRTSRQQLLCYNRGGGKNERANALPQRERFPIRATGDRV